MHLGTFQDYDNELRGDRYVLFIICVRARVCVGEGRGGGGGCNCVCVLVSHVYFHFSAEIAIW